MNSLLYTMHRPIALLKFLPFHSTVALSLVVLIAISAAKADQCPNYFTHLEGQCYFFGTASATWFEAWQQCALMGADLLSLETEKESDAIFHEIQRMLRSTDSLRHSDNKTSPVSAAYWTSGTSLTGKNNWVWLGSGLTMFTTDWCPGQPDNKSGLEHCIKLLVADDKRCWNDRTCFSKDSATAGVDTFYICETPPSKCD